MLYTRDNAAEADLLPHDASNLGHFDSSRKTIVVMHGFTGSGEEMGHRLKAGKRLI